MNYVLKQALVRLKWRQRAMKPNCVRPCTTPSSSHLLTKRTKVELNNISSPHRTRIHTIPHTSWHRLFSTHVTQQYHHPSTISSASTPSQHIRTSSSFTIPVMDLSHTFLHVSHIQKGLIPEMKYLVFMLISTSRGTGSGMINIKHRPMMPKPEQHGLMW